MVPNLFQNLDGSFRLSSFRSSTNWIPAIAAASCRVSLESSDSLASFFFQNISYRFGECLNWLPLKTPSPAPRPLLHHPWVCSGL